MLIDTLKLFTMVINYKSFSKAAEELYISQPSVSLQIRNLENELGTKLIHRSPKHVEPTHSGEILYTYAQNILELYEKAKQEIDQLKHVVTGSLKIGASFTIGEYILPHVLAEFAPQYPNVNVEVTIANTEEVAQGIHSNQLDVGLIEGAVNYPDIKDYPFESDEMILVVSKQHAFARRKIVNAEDLQDQVWILREGGSGTRAYTDQLIKDLNLSIKRSYIFSSSQGVKESVISGLGIALISSLTVQKELASEELIAVRVKGKRLMRTLSILLSKDVSSSRAIEAFTEKVTAAASHLMV